MHLTGIFQGGFNDDPFGAPFSNKPDPFSNFDNTNSTGQTEVSISVFKFHLITTLVSCVILHLK